MQVLVLNSVLTVLNIYYVYPNLIYQDKNMIDIAHFRWTDTRLPKTEKRYTDYKEKNKQGVALNWKESEKILNYLKVER